MISKYKQILAAAIFSLSMLSPLSAEKLNAQELNPANQVAVQQAAMKIWGTTVSPYVRKVCIICLEKNAAYQVEETFPKKVLLALHKNVPAEFEHASPLGKIPALDDNGYTISDSAVIAAYLEKKYPNNPLYPTDKESYARVLWFEKYVDDEMSKALHNKIFFERVLKPALFNAVCNEETVQVALEHELPPYLDYLEHAIKDGSWPQYEGRTTVADIALTSHYVDLKMSKVELDAKRWPALVEHVEKVLNRPSFVKMSP